MLALTRSLLVGTASFASLLALNGTAHADDFGTRPAHAASPIAPVDAPPSPPRPETNRATPPEPSEIRLPPTAAIGIESASPAGGAVFGGAPACFEPV